MGMTTLVPAYGRDYKSKKEVLAAWDEGKDFIINDNFHASDGKPINKPQAKPGEKFNIRYKKLTAICTVSG
jgi:hypothetical protein